MANLPSLANMMNLRLNARADQTFKFARDFSNFAPRIESGALIRMQISLNDGSKFIFSSNQSEAGAKGRFTYDFVSKIGWFEASLADIRSIPREALKNAKGQYLTGYAASIEQDGGVEIIMSGSISWKSEGEISPYGDATNVAANIGNTVFADGDSDSVTVLPITLAGAMAAALAEAKAYTDAQIAAKFP